MQELSDRTGKYNSVASPASFVSETTALDSIRQYQSELAKDNRLSLSDSQLSQYRADLKDAYQAWKKESGGSVNRQSKAYSDYLSAHSRITAEQIARKGIKGQTLEQVLEPRNGVQNIQGNAADRLNRYISLNEGHYDTDKVADAIERVSEALGSNYETSVKGVRQAYQSRLEEAEKSNGGKSPFLTTANLLEVTGRLRFGKSPSGLREILDDSDPKNGDTEVRTTLATSVNGSTQRYQETALATSVGVGLEIGQDSDIIDLSPEIQDDGTINYVLPEDVDHSEQGIAILRQKIRGAYLEQGTAALDSQKTTFTPGRVADGEYNYLIGHAIFRADDGTIYTTEKEGINISTNNGETQQAVYIGPKKLALNEGEFSGLDDIGVAMVESGQFTVSAILDMQKWRTENRRIKAARSSLFDETANLSAESLDDTLYDSSFDEDQGITQEGIAALNILGERLRTKREEKQAALRAELYDDSWFLKDDEPSSELNEGDRYVERASRLAISKRWGQKTDHGMRNIILAAAATAYFLGGYIIDQAKVPLDLPAMSTAYAAPLAESTVRSERRGLAVLPPVAQAAPLERRASELETPMGIRAPIPFDYSRPAEDTSRADVRSPEPTPTTRKAPRAKRTRRSGIELRGGSSSRPAQPTKVAPRPSQPKGPITVIREDGVKETLRPGTRGYRDFMNSPRGRRYLRGKGHRR